MELPGRTQEIIDDYDLRMTLARNALRAAGVPEVIGEVPHHRALDVHERIALLAAERDALRKATR